ncbi:replication P family protein [Escherichia coli 3-373-03_S3_C3]|nr:replication P family protein [Escherichia coli 3-373-03_S3_C3]KDU08013.1 replication P family protein [Escherichia coli 3-373-03_S3_C2]
MKNIAAQMVNFDREQMRRIANNMPEQYDEKPQVQQVQEKTSCSVKRIPKQNAKHS